MPDQRQVTFHPGSPDVRRPVRLPPPLKAAGQPVAVEPQAPAAGGAPAAPGAAQPAAPLKSILRHSPAQAPAAPAGPTQQVMDGAADLETHAREFREQARTVVAGGRRPADFLGDCINAIDACGRTCWTCGCLDPCCPTECNSRTGNCSPAMKWAACCTVGIVVGCIVALAD